MNNYVIIFDYKQADYDDNREEYISPIVWSGDGAATADIIFDSLEQAKDTKKELEILFPAVRYKLYQLTEVTE